MKSKRSRACDISPKVREQVLSRDARRCTLCGSTYRLELAHAFLPRSRGGLGKKENLITLCQRHHRMLDSGKAEEQEAVRIFVDTYMKNKYGKIDLNKLKYDKFSWLKEGESK